MKQNVLLVSYNQRGAAESIPLGVAYISAILKKAGYPVKVLDFNMMNDYDFDVSPYDIVGFSVTTGNILAFALKHIERIKSTSDKIVVIGGSLPSVVPEQFLKETKADFTIQGEGEEVILNLLKSLETNDPPLNSIPGLGFRDNGKIVLNPPRRISNLDKLPTPDFDAFELGKYLKNKNSPMGQFDSRYSVSITLFTSRGCNFNCRMCTHPFYGEWKGQSAERIIEDVKYCIKKFKIKNIVFFDDDFLLSRQRILKFCKLVKPLQINWTCETRVNWINEEIIQKMKDSGCVYIRLGLESGSDRVLKLMNKGQDMKMMDRALTILKKTRMPVKAGFLFGTPGETIDDAKATLRFIKRIYRTLPNSKLLSYYYMPQPATYWTILLEEKLGRKPTLNDFVIINKYHMHEINFSKMKKGQIRYCLLMARLYSLWYEKNAIKNAIKLGIKNRLVYLRRGLYHKLVWAVSLFSAYKFF